MLSEKIKSLLRTLKPRDASPPEALNTEAGASSFQSRLMIKIRHQYTC